MATRELNFRYRDSKEKEMYPELSYFEKFPMAIFGLDGRLQYIGLKDKSGKSIFEGDIVRFKHNADNVIGGQTEIGEVRWYDDRLGYGFQTGAKNHDYWGYSDDMFDFEVIGNIYENPDLLPTPTP